MKLLEELKMMLLKKFIVNLTPAGIPNGTPEAIDVAVGTPGIFPNETSEGYSNETSREVPISERTFGERLEATSGEISGRTSGVTPD